ncbi:MAG: riboflavin synthase subunit alpha [Buchnera aphidicola (Nurudea shiraii)]
MFTGIIQDIATITLIKRYENFFQWTLELHNINVQTLCLGSSLSCNGCCLTIKKIEKKNTISLDIIQETLRITSLRSFHVGENINIEKSMKLGEEIGGHLVSGHVITTATIFKIIASSYNKELWMILHDCEIMKYIFCKGFICVDGISLTVGNIVNNTFCVFLIPETILRTTIGHKNIGDIVNLEVDYFSKIIVDRISN